MNFYDIFGVDRDADRSEVRAAYRSLARRYHPDVNDHPRAGDQFKVLTRARDVLTDETERAAYDRLGHADYVRKRLDGPLPDVEMAPKPGDDAGVDPPSQESPFGPTSEDAGTNRSGGTGNGIAGGRSGDSGGRTPTGSTADRGAARRSTPTNSGGAEGDAEGAAGTAGDAGTGKSTPSEGRTAGESGRTTAGAGTTDDTNQKSADSGSSPEPGDEPDSDTRAGGSSRRTTGGAGRSSTGAGDEDGDQPAGGEKTHSTPSTPGEATGPERLRNDPTRASRRLGSTGATIRAHFGASHRWLGVVAATGVYGAGLAGYLLASADRLGVLYGDLTSGDTTAMVGAVVGSSDGVPGLLEYGLGGGGVQMVGALSLLGAFLLPAALAVAVYGLRRQTTWRPSWLHVLGGLGPLASVALPLIDAVPRVPVLVDLLLVVGCPAVVVASFLLNRLVLVAPLRRREDLGLP